MFDFVLESVKDLYRDDGVIKNFRVSFPNESLPDFTNAQIGAESVKLTESMQSGYSLKMGDIEGSSLEFDCYTDLILKGKVIEAGSDLDISSGCVFTNKVYIISGGLTAYFSYNHGTENPEGYYEYGLPLLLKVKLNMARGAAAIRLSTSDTFPTATTEYHTITDWTSKEITIVIDTAKSFIRHRQNIYIGLVYDETLSGALITGAELTYINPNFLNPDESLINTTDNTFDKHFTYRTDIDLPVFYMPYGKFKISESKKGMHPSIRKVVAYQYDDFGILQNNAQLSSFERAKLQVAIRSDDTYITQRSVNRIMRGYYIPFFLCSNLNTLALLDPDHTSTWTSLDSLGYIIQDNAIVYPDDIDIAGHTMSINEDAVITTSTSTTFTYRVSVTYKQYKLPAQNDPSDSNAYPNHILQADYDIDKDKFEESLANLENIREHYIVVDEVALSEAISLLQTMVKTICNPMSQIHSEAADSSLYDEDFYTYSDVSRAIFNPTGMYDFFVYGTKNFMSFNIPQTISITLDGYTYDIDGLEVSGATAYFCNEVISDGYYYAPFTSSKSPYDLSILPIIAQRDTNLSTSSSVMVKSDFYLDNDSDNTDFVLDLNTILRNYLELTGKFGYIDRVGYGLKSRSLEKMGALYPDPQLYPAEDLYPKRITIGIANSLLRDVWFDDENTTLFDKIQYNYKYRSIDDSGTIVEKDEVKETYTIIEPDATYDSRNYQTYDLTNNAIFNCMIPCYVGSNSTRGASTLSENDFIEAVHTAVENIARLLYALRYVKSRITMKGLPYIEVGDNLVTLTPDSGFDTFVFRRTLTGIQSLKDVVEVN